VRVLLLRKKDIYTTVPFIDIKGSQNCDAEESYLMAKKQTINFEESLRNLESLVKQLEQGDLSLEESLKAFEVGIKLTRECSKQLDEAEQKVSVLVGEGDDLRLVDFNRDTDKNIGRE
jgi:exodeoxyribonuclease VII small subunit